MSHLDSETLVAAVRAFLDLNDRGAADGETSEWIDEWEAALRKLRVLASAWPK